MKIWQNFLEKFQVSYHSNKQTAYIYYIDNARVYGFIEDKDEIPNEAVEVKEVEVHPAQLDWIEDVYFDFETAQIYLQSLFTYEEKESEEPNVD